MSFSTILRYPLSVLSIVIAASIFCVLRFQEVNFALFPDASHPEVLVMVYPDGMGIDDFREEFGEQIESRISGVKGVESYRGQYSSSSVRWQVQFEWGVDIDRALIDLRTSLNGIESRMPREWNGIYVEENPSKQQRFLYSVSSDRLTLEQMDRYFYAKLDTALAAIPDLDSYRIISPGRERVEVAIKLNYEKLLEFHVSPQEVIQKLKNNITDEVYSSLELDTNESFGLMIPVRERKLEDIKNIVVKQDSLFPLHLKHLAEVYIQPRSFDMLLAVDARPGFLVSVQIKSGANLIQVANRVEHVLDAAIADVDIDQTDISWRPVIEPKKPIFAALWNIAESIGLGVVIATAIIFLFLGSLRLTLIIALCIPLSGIGGFLLMELFGIEVNLISLGAMALSVGMVVDGAVVVIDHVSRVLAEEQPENHLDWLSAIKRAVLEVRRPVVSSLLTTIVVFLPLAFTSPIANAVLGDLAKVMVCVLAVSVLLTITVVPSFVVLLTHFSQRMETDQNLVGKAFQSCYQVIEDGYAQSLDWIFSKKFRGLVLIVVVLSLITGSIYTLSDPTLIKRNLIDEPVPGMIYANITTLDNFDSLEEAMAYGSKLSSMIAKQNPEIDIETNITEAFSWNGQHVSVLIFIFASGQDANKISESWNQKYGIADRARIHFRPRNFSGMKLPSFGLAEFDVVGISDADKREKHKRLVRYFQEDHFSDLANYQESPAVSDKKRIELNWTAVGKLMVSGQLASDKGEVSKVVKDWVNPILSKDKTKGRKVILLEGPGRQIPIHIRTNYEFKNGLDDLGNVLIPVSDRVIPLRHLLEKKVVDFSDQIETVNGKNVFRVLVRAMKAKMSREEAEDRIAEALVKESEYSSLPKIPVVFNNPSTEIDKNIDSLLQAFLYALVLIWIVVVLQFGSIAQSLIVMSAIPLGLVGIAFALYVFSAPLSVNSMLGLLLMAGMSVNNSIMLIEFFNQLKVSKTDFSMLEILVLAARLRLRPIMMTTLTTLLGMMPLAVGYGTGGAVLQPLGIAICGGLGLSTFLTLFCVPVLVSLFCIGVKQRETYA